MSKKKAPRKTTKKERRTGLGRKPTAWHVVTEAELVAYRDSFSSQVKCAKALGVSITSLRTWLGAGKFEKKIPSLYAQERIRAAIDKAAKKPTKKPAAQSKAKRPTGALPPEGVSLLAMAIVEEDWSLARQAYDLLK